MKIEFPGQELRNKAFRTDFEQGAYLETQTRVSEQICLRCEIKQSICGQTAEKNDRKV